MTTLKEPESLALPLAVPARTLRTKPKVLLPAPTVEWADFTASPWWGCTKVDAECDHCYAETLDARQLHGPETHWGKGKPRKPIEGFASKVRSLNRKARVYGRRIRVFPSMCDPFDAEVPAEWKRDLFEVIRSTPNLMWLLLTKRPGRILRDLPKGWGNGWRNVALGTSVGRKESKNRLEALCHVPAVLRFVSFEPLLNDVGDLSPWLPKQADWVDDGSITGPTAPFTIGWGIIGGESGAKAREFHIEHGRGVLRQLQAAKVPAYCKQLGRRPVIPLDDPRHAGHSNYGPKGGNLNAFPFDFRVREVPRVALEF